MKVSDEQLEIEILRTLTWLITSILLGGWLLLTAIVVIGYSVFGFRLEPIDLPGCENEISIDGTIYSASSLTLDKPRTLHARIEVGLLYDDGLRKVQFGEAEYRWQFSPDSDGTIDSVTLNNSWNMVFGNDARSYRVIVEPKKVEYCLPDRFLIDFVDKPAEN